MKLALISDFDSLFTGNVEDHVRILESLPGVSTEVLDFREVLSNPDILTSCDVLIHHYTLRLAIPHYPLALLAIERKFKGPKWLFIQDEYDHVNLTKGAISFVGYDVVFTCVPELYVRFVYRGLDLDRVRFVNVLTGYWPAKYQEGEAVAMEERPTVVGYRGRVLPTRYGALSKLKWEIGDQLKELCQHHGIPHDISSAEQDRIYGAAWFDFLRSCRVSPVTPSGSNVFDYNGCMASYPSILRFPRKLFKKLRNSRQSAEHSIMNQISPRVYEAISQGTVLVVPKDSFMPFLEPNLNCLAYSANATDDERFLAELKDLDKLRVLSQNASNLISPSGPLHRNRLIEKVSSEIAGLEDWEHSRSVRAFVRDNANLRASSSNLYLQGRFILIWLADYHLPAFLWQFRKIRPLQRGFALLKSLARRARVAYVKTQGRE